MTTGNNTEVADTDQEMSLVDRLRLGGPNAMEVAQEAADEIERQRTDLAYAGSVQESQNNRICELLEETVRLLRVIDNIQAEAERPQGNGTHLKRVIALQCRNAVGQ